MEKPSNLSIPNDLKVKFKKKLLQWYKENKRNFPWRNEKDPYKILISEVLLQKTDAPKVLPVYNKIIQHYPTVEKLKTAALPDLRNIFKDVGLLYRAERLINICSDIVDRKIPYQKDHLLQLNGLGEYISSAICCFAFNKREAIVDTNIIRLLERVFDYHSTKKRPRDDKALWNFAQSLLPVKKAKDYNYALLDFSSIQCTARKPEHEKCPLKNICHFYNQSINEKRKLIAIDIFAGAGGLSLGFEKAGFDVIYAIEKDKYAAETYKKNRRNKRLVIEAKDINEISPREVLQKTRLRKGEVDVIIGGPPCQGFSASNKRTRNMDNPRNHLVFRFIEFVQDIKPKWFVMENVGGLDSFDDGNLKKQLIDMFASIGYSTESFIINAVDFGVPQNRNRIFFIGNNVGNSMDFVTAITTERINNTITVYDAISDLPSLENGHNISIMKYKDSEKKLSSYQKLLRKGMNGKVSNNLVSKSSELAIKRYVNIRQGENLIALAKRRPELASNYTNIANCHHWIYLRLSWERPSVTLNNFRKNMLIHPTEDRGLSVREAARLQSFPDRYVFYGPLGFQQQQVANAVPPLLSLRMAELILKEITTWA
jgi:DNA (cytosine-5)-methyltransferase 1